MLIRYCDICGEEISNEELNTSFLSLHSTDKDDWNLDVCKECERKLKAPNVIQKLKELIART